MPQAGKIKKIITLNQNTKKFIIAGKNFASTPGQFVSLWIPSFDEKPFSVADDTGSEIHLIVCRVGEFTKELFSLQEGTLVGLRGPFGKAFSILKNKNIVLLGGGFGTAPLYFLGKALQKKGCKVNFLVGARNSKNLLLEAEAKKAGFNVFLATDDGSKGFKGTSVDLLQEILTQQKIDAIQTCGPEKMMKNVALLAKKKNIFCELSLERYIKCGFGVCGQCVCSGERMCLEGPVVSAEWALKQKEFGLYKRDAQGEKVYF